MAKIVEVTNPVTGQPTQVDQLDHTAQQIDDAIARALPGGYYDKWVSQLVNPNLLDNWYFGNPVDQRQGRVVKPNTTYYSDNTLATAAGTTSAYVTAYRYATGTASGVNYASFKLVDSDSAPTYYAAPENVVRGYTGAGYGIDRWSIIYNPNNAAILIDNTGIKLAETAPIIWAQSLPAELSSYYNGKIVTLSALLSDGNLIALTTEFPISGQSQQASASGISIYIISAAQSADGYAKFGVIFGAENASIIAAKLELGSQQTLAHQDADGNWVLNEIPDYGEQLARCQRYFQRIVVPVSTMFIPVNDNLIVYQCNLSVQMRAEPSVTCGTFFIVSTNNNSTVFSENFVTPIKLSASVNSVVIRIEKTQSNPVTVGRSGGVYVGSYYDNPGTRIIDCTADL